MERVAGGRVAVTLAVFAAVLLLVGGCSGGGSDGKTVVRFVTWKPNQPEVWAEVLRRFAAEHPEIEVRREVGPHSSTAFHDLLTQKLKNRSRDVDVFLMDVVWPPEFASAGWAAPLDERFPAAEQARFFPGVIDANTYRGKIYGVPLYQSSGLLYYRKDLLEAYSLEPPETWPQLVARAAAVVRGEAQQDREIHGFSGQFKQYEGLICDMLEFVHGNGGAVLDPASGAVTLARPAALDAVRFVRDELIGTLAPRGVLTYQEPESLTLFVQGRAVFHRNWPYAWEVANNPEKSAVAGKVGMLPVPHFPEGESHGTLGGWQVGVSAFSPNPDAAWTFAAFLTSEPVQKLLAVRAGLAPTRAALYEDPEVLAANPQFHTLRQVFQGSRPRPRSPVYPAVSGVLQRYFSSALATADSDLETLAADAERALQKLVDLTAE